MNIEFKTDSNGMPRVIVDGKRSVLSGYLEQDVQSDLASVELIVEICARVAAGELERWEGTGNAHTVIIESCVVRIENEFTEAAIELSLEGFLASVRGWGEFIRSRRSVP